MAATYTEISLEDMDRFLRRAYRALRPKQGKDRGEVYYDLNLSDGNIFIRVWTSIRPSSGSGAGVGQDAIRVTMVTKGGRPLVKKGKIVKRTQGWKNNLQDRVDGLLEDYESKTGYWKNRQQERDDVKKDEEPVPEPPPPPVGGAHNGQFAKDRSGKWLAKIFTEGHSGDDTILRTKAGKEARVVLDERVWKGKDRFSGNYSELWTFERRGGSRYASTEDVTALLVAEASMLRDEDLVDY